jgi:hypothetical protein
MSLCQDQTSLGRLDDHKTLAVCDLALDAWPRDGSRPAGTTVRCRSAKIATLDGPDWGNASSARAADRLLDLRHVVLFRQRSAAAALLAS